MYKGFKRENRRDLLSHISPECAFIKNIDYSKHNWRNSTRNVSTSKTAHRYGKNDSGRNINAEDSFNDRNYSVPYT